MNEQLIYGIHAVKALINNPKRKIKHLYINKERKDNRLQEIVELANSKKIAIQWLGSKDIQQNHSEINHQGVVALVEPQREYSEKDLLRLLSECESSALVLVLDGITDPHNLGACLRTADAAGVDFVVIPKDNNAGITSVVSKVACGAAESIPLVKVTNLVRAMEVLKKEGVWIYGAAGEAKHSLYEMSLEGHMAIVMGAEGKGLRRLTREHCDGLFSLPMLGAVDSLNVSVATGVSLYEVVRQREKDKR